MFTPGERLVWKLLGAAFSIGLIGLGIIFRWPDLDQPGTSAPQWAEPVMYLCVAGAFVFAAATIVEIIRQSRAQPKYDRDEHDRGDQYD